MELAQPSLLRLRRLAEVPRDRKNFGYGVNLSLLHIVNSTRDNAGKFLNDDFDSLCGFRA